MDVGVVGQRDTGYCGVDLFAPPAIAYHRAACWLRRVKNQQQISWRINQQASIAHNAVMDEASKTAIGVINGKSGEKQHRRAGDGDSVNGISVAAAPDGAIGIAQRKSFADMAHGALCARRLARTAASSESSSNGVAHRMWAERAKRSQRRRGVMRASARAWHLSGARHRLFASNIAYRVVGRRYRASSLPRS